MSPGVVGNRLLEIRPVPIGLIRRLGHQRLQTLLGRGITARVETVLVERFIQSVDLRLGDLDLGLADLREIARRHVSDQQADDHDHDQQLEQGEAGNSSTGGFYQDFLTYAGNRDATRSCAAGPTRLSWHGSQSLPVSPDITRKPAL